MAKGYVKFEVSKEISDKALEAVRLARQSNGVRKGVNEATKSIERGMATLVVLAEDVEPEEVVMHIPMLCEQKRMNLVYVPTKQALGNAAGLKVPCAAIAIEKSAEAEPLIKDIASKISGKMPASEKKAEAAPVEKKEAKPKAPKPKKEEAK
ncbi:MAG: 50S ribosomal protein L7Ae [Candidatus Micrarchaeota archaeon]|nr:50S ribosomal protein L7Ae [Candidatus Micrarchaeota archaeon]MDE1846711.1 50S ribosomal protein L7Ae [Candidatus Micrarchaeota archaeon]